MQFLHISIFMLFVAPGAHAKVKQAELQWALCGQSVENVGERLNASEDDQKLRDLYYLETPQKEFFEQNVILRFRESKKGIKSAVKRQYALGAKIPFDDFEGLGAVCEQDTYLGSAKVGCSVKEEPQHLGDLTRDQEKFLESVGVEPALERRAKIWGPLTEMEWNFKHNGQDLTIDTVYVNDKVFAMEISTRVDLEEMEKAQKTWTEYFRKKGLRLCQSQAGRTSALLALLIDKKAH